MHLRRVAFAYFVSLYVSSCALVSHREFGQDAVPYGMRLEAYEIAPETRLSFPVAYEETEFCEHDRERFRDAFEFTVSVWNENFREFELDTNVTMDSVRWFPDKNSAEAGPSFSYLSKGALIVMSAPGQLPDTHAVTWSPSWMRIRGLDTVYEDRGHRIILSQDKSKSIRESVRGEDRTLYYSGSMLHELGHAALGIPDPSGCYHAHGMMGEVSDGNTISVQDVISAMKRKDYRSDLRRFRKQWSRSGLIEEACDHRSWLASLFGW